jgi:hypothetical protein
MDEKDEKADPDQGHPSSQDSGNSNEPTANDTIQVQLERAFDPEAQGGEVNGVASHDGPVKGNDVSDVPTPPANLPVIGEAGARLPENYQAVVAALEACNRIDECLEWRNKATALASYAKQSKDPTLSTFALRIKLRAIRRVGELLQEIKPGQGARGGIRRDASVPPPVTRTSAAIDAGLTERERKTALRLASVKTEDFRAAVESDNPPSVTKLITPSRRTNSAAKWKSPKIENYRAFVKFLPRMCTAAYVVAKTAPHLDREEREQDAQVITDAIAALQSLRRAVDIKSDDVPPTGGVDGQEQA